MKTPQLKKHLNFLKDILVQSLEQADDKGIFQGHFVTHDDIPDETPLGYDDHFYVCGDEDEPSYIVCIRQFTPEELNEAAQTE